MSGEQAGDKSFDATPERLKRAREKGDVPVSPEVAVLASLAGLLLGLGLAGTAALRSAETLTGAFLRPEDVAASLFAGQGAGLTRALLLPVAALVLPGAALVVLGLIAQRGIVVAPSKIKPDLKKIDPVSNAKKKYGAQGMGEFARSAAKIVAVTLLGGGYLWSRADAYLAAVGAHPGGVPEAFRDELSRVLLIGVLVALVAAMLDLPFRRLRHAARLKMTRQEVMDETKENEGDQAQKQSRRKRAGEIARSRMLRDTAEATVVIMNPTHYAVALKWSPESGAVPSCVAKGVDHLALAIRDRARAAGVPVREDPPCARALHAAVEVGEPIRPEHYAAVAAAIRFAEAVRRAR